MNTEMKELRDEIIFNEYEVLEPSGGIRRFQNLTIGRLDLLIREHIAKLDELQNEGPNIDKFWKFGKNDNKGFKRKIFYEGYVYTDDNSLSPIIDGVREIIDKTDIEGLLRFVDNFRQADEFSIKELDNKYYLRAWWD